MRYGHHFSKTLGGDCLQIRRLVRPKKSVAMKALKSQQISCIQTTPIEIM